MIERLSEEGKFRYLFGHAFPISPSLTNHPSHQLPILRIVGINHFTGSHSQLLTFFLAEVDRGDRVGKEHAEVHVADAPHHIIHCPAITLAGEVDEQTIDAFAAESEAAALPFYAGYLLLRDLFLVDAEVRGELIRAIVGQEEGQNGGKIFRAHLLEEESRTLQHFVVVEDVVPVAESGISDDAAHDAGLLTADAQRFH